MKKIELVQGSQEWLDFRKNKIGASDVPIIMGVSPWKTPYQLWEEKTGRRQSAPPSAAMKRGTKLEEEARKCFIKESGIDVQPAVFQSDSCEFMIASLDGWNEEKRVAVEIKCPGKEDHSNALVEQIPTKYYPQLQHQMYVCDLNSMYYYSYYPLEYALGAVCRTHFIVKRDDDFIAKMLAAEYEFWLCIKNNTPPALTSADYALMDSAEWKEAADLLKSTMAKRKALEDLESNLRAQLISMANNQNCYGSGIKLTSYTTKGRIQYDKIQALKSINLDEFRAPETSNWRITVE